MNVIEKATIRRFHQHRLDSFGMGEVASLGWKQAESQQRRFEVIAQVVNPSNKSLLDVGCGYGDLKAYLDDRFEPFHYTGIDQMPQFITEGKRRFAHQPDSHFFQTDFAMVDFPKVDIVVASGALGYRAADPTFYKRMIAKMFLSAGKVLVFNLLDSATFPENALLKGHNSEEIEKFCKQLSERVEVISGYFPHDFTVVMRCGSA